MGPPPRALPGKGQLRRLGLLLGALAVGAASFWATSGAAAERDAAAAARSTFDASAPAGFDTLLGPQQAMVDVYYGGRRVGTAMAEYQPGLIRFLNAKAVTALVPRLIRTSEIGGALQANLPTHSEKVCTVERTTNCGRLETDRVGVIFDEARFRADLFVNPAYLDIDTPLVSRYIPPPDNTPSLAATVGGAVSGGTDSRATYNLQGRVVANYGAAHLSADLAQSSTFGLQVQSLAATVDHGPLRAEAGLLLSPGIDLIGQGRFYGASIKTQTDTLLNRDQITATSILIYLPNRAQVDVILNGRLMGSRLYEAGNQLIDTSNLPEGAYTLTLHIREAGGYTHDETRSFNKSRTMPPPGLPQFFLGAGVLAQDNTTGFPVASGLLVEGGYACRLTSFAAFDLSAALVGRRTFGEVGFTFVGPSGLRLRGAGLVADDGGVGLLLGAAFNLGRSTVLTLDARQGWNGNAQAATVASSDPLLQSVQQNQFGLGLNASQISASFATTWRGLQLGVLASYSSSPFAKSSHTIGPTFEAPVRFAGVDLRFVANAAHTERGVQAYFGFRLHFDRRRMSVYGDTGVGSTSTGDGRHEIGPAVNLTAASSYSDDRVGEATASANYSHANDQDAVAIGGQVRGEHGDFTAQVDHDLSGPNPGTHYSGSFVIGAAVTASRVAVGSASGGESGVIVDVVGAPKGSEFEVLINDTPHARIHAGERLPIMLPAYRVYSIRLAPKGGASLDFDTSAREVSLYPGAVRALTWKAQRVVEVFGRVVDEEGLPIAQASIQGGRYPMLTDDNGYFQVEVAQDTRLRFERPHRLPCELGVTGFGAASGHISLGTRRCYRLTTAEAASTLTIASAAKTREP